MNEVVFVDTNVIVWISVNKEKRLSRSAVNLIKKSHLAYSPMVFLELSYLYEIGRITRHAEEVIDILDKSLSISEMQSNFADVCKTACSIGWTRDIFDRMIVADAALHKAKLVTADEKILKHYKRAVW